MKIVLPIFFAAVIMGLFSRKITAGHWMGLICWIILVTAYNYLKN